MPGVVPSLVLHPVPAITLTGNLGDSWRLDYINRFGPIDAWVTLDTVTLTNTSQLYLDVSAPASRSGFTDVSRYLNGVSKLAKECPYGSPSIGRAK